MFNLTKATIKSKMQLWIGYFLLAAVLVLAGVASYNYVTRLKLDNKVTTLEGKVTAAENRVKLVEEVNQQQADALDTIKSLNGVNDTMLKGLATDMEALRVRDRTAFNRLAALEKSNEAVRKYLNTVVPAPVGCVLDRTCPDPDGDGVPATQRGAAATVPAARAGAQQDKR
jgi:hypothetical protein